MAGLKKLLKRHGGKKSSKEDVRFGEEMAFGYNITKDKDLPKLHKAVWNADLAKLKQLAKKSDLNQFDKENRTPLHLACACGYDDIAQFLLSNKVKTNLCDNDGRTALMKSIECSHMACIQLLLDHNADVRVSDLNNSSPLHLCAANNLTNVAIKLIERRLDINISDKEGFTALHVASSLGNQDFVVFLLNKAAEVNKTDAHGRTALMTAAADGHMDIVKMLLQHDADVTMKDSEGWKAADHAVMNGMHSCAKIIDEHEERKLKEKEAESKPTNAKQSPLKERTKTTDINEVLRTTSPVLQEDLGFSFGGPAADKTNADGNLRSEGSTSRQSDVDDSWASSSFDDNYENNKETTKVSLAAALKNVDRSVSNVSDTSQSRIPIRDRNVSPDSNNKPDKVSNALIKPKSPQAPSKIPRPSSSKPTSPREHPSTHASPENTSKAGKRTSLSPNTSVKSAEESPWSSPGSSLASPRPALHGASPSKSGTHGKVTTPQTGGSLPLEYLEAPKDDKNVAPDHGYSPSFLSPKSDHSNRNLADELGLSPPGSSDDENFDDESIISAEVDFDNNIAVKQEPEKPKTLTSTTKLDNKEVKEPRHAAAYLGLDLGSSISSVSDPDVSGISDVKKASNVVKKVESVQEPTKLRNEDKIDKDDDEEETESNWDSSEGLLPSDDEITPGKSSSRPLSSHDMALKQAVLKRRDTLEKSMKEESDVKRESGDFSEDVTTESESENAREREERRREELEKMKEMTLAKMRKEEARQEEEKLRLEVEKRQKEEENARQQEKAKQEELRLNQLKEKEELARIEQQKQEEEAKRKKKEALEAEKARKEQEIERQRMEEQRMAEERQKEQEEKRKQLLEQQRKADEENEKRLLEQEKREEILLKQKEQEEMEAERRKEEARRLKWEREEQQREAELAASIKKELENEIEAQQESNEGSFSTDVGHDHRNEFDGEESSKWDSTLGEGTDGENEGSLETIENNKVEEMTSEKETELKEDRLNNNVETQQPKLVRDREYAPENRNSGYNETITSDTGDSGALALKDESREEMVHGKTVIDDDIVSKDARTEVISEDHIVKEHEDALLEAYRVQQERKLEEERALEENKVRQELQREEDTRQNIEREKEAQRQKIEEMEKERKEQEMVLEKKRIEKDLQRQKEIEESVKRQKEDEKQRREIERIKMDEARARAQDMFDSSSDQFTDLDDSPKTKTQSALAEKHKEFIEEQESSTSLALQKVYSKERLADRSREIQQQRQEAKVDLNAARLETDRLARNTGSRMQEIGVKSKSPLRDTSPINYNIARLNNSDLSRPGNSDWSTSSEDDVPLPRTKTPLSSADGGLGSSVSPGLYGHTRPINYHTLPLSNTSPGAVESSPLTVQLKGSLRETKRQLEKSQEKVLLAETQIKQFENHVEQLQTQMTSLTERKNDLESDMFDVREENRSLKHKCSRALEDKKIAESLTETVREQLHRSEEKLTREIEVRRNTEQIAKKLEIERLNVENALRLMSKAKDEVKRSLEREQEQGKIKDQLYNEQKKQIEEILLESQKVSQHRANVLNQLESVDEHRKNEQASSESLKRNLIAAKSEVTRLTSQLESVTKLSQNEIDSLKIQLNDANGKLRNVQETLGDVRADYEAKMSHFQTTMNDQQNRLEKELATRHAAESEAAVLRSRLESADAERNEANKLRIETEKQLHNVREEMYKTKSSLDKELATIRENYQLASLKLNTAENKVNSLEAELQSANILLAERSTQMSINLRDMDTRNSSVSKLEAELRNEKETNVRLQTKLETSLDKMKTLEMEAEGLRRQLDMASESVRQHESTSKQTQDKLNSTISEIRTDYEKKKGKMSENERRLLETVERYKGEVEKNVEQHKQLEETIRTLQRELVETTRKQSVAEASLEIQIKERENLEKERDHLRQSLRTYEEQMTVKINETQLVNGHASVLQNELDHSRKVSDETSQRLATTSYDLENLGKIKTGLEGDINKLKLDRIKLEATLNEEKAKSNLLLQEIRESNQGRTNLESLLSQIKTSNIDLQERLQTETFTKSQHERDAEEAKGMWEFEVRARSKLGAKIIEMENKVNEAKLAAEEEKKKTRKALENKKTLQGKLEVYEKRSDQHQKEVQTLKGQIKALKRRVKDYEMTEQRVPALQAEFNREIQQYENNISLLRNQLRDVNEKLRQECDLRAFTEHKGKQQEKDLVIAKTQIKEHLREVQKLEKMNRKTEDEIDRLKEIYDKNFIEKAQLERIKMDIEAKSRVELNRKLADVNAHLEEQAVAREVLEKSRSEQHLLKEKEMENIISRLKKENENYKTTLHQLETERQTKEVEAVRFKDMYEKESIRKQHLDEMLFKEREKSAETKAILNLERSRSNKLLGNSPINATASFLGSPTSFDFNSQRNESMKNRSPTHVYTQSKDKLLESVDKELSKSIQKHLDSISSNETLDNWTNKDIQLTSSPVITSSNQYMETLKRNYFV